MSLVKTKKNPITGSLVVADVVLTAPLSGERDMHALQGDILLLSAKLFLLTKSRPAINFIPALTVAESGKPYVAMHNVIVTGGSRGLGLGIARKLTRTGYRVIAIARKQNNELTAAMQEAETTAPGSFHFVPFDFTEIENI